MAAQQAMAYYPPMDPSMFGLLSLALGGAGLFVMAAFFVYEMNVTQSGEARSLAKEVGMASVSSLLLGLGALFLTLWFGIYV